MPTHRVGRESGFVLIAGLFLVILIGGLAVGLLEESRAAKSYLELHEDNLRALETAEIGIVRAEMEIRALVDHDQNGVGNTEGEIADGAFSVSVHDDPVSEDRWMLRARGTRGMSIRTIEVGVRRRVNRYFVEGMFALDAMTLGGDLQTDKYDSDVGNYAAQAVNVDAGGAFAKPGGHVGSNADITILGSDTYIRGNAIPGPQRVLDISGTPTIYGDQTPRMESIDILPEPYEDFLAAYSTNDNDAALGSLSGNKIKYTAAQWNLSITAESTLTLPAGTYFFRDVVMKGGSTIVADGEVHIYVTGTLDLSGGAIVNPGPPANLQIHAHPYPLPTNAPPTQTLVKVNGGSQAAFTVYGPGADVVVGGGSDVFGAIVGKTIDVSGDCYFHYDAALGRVGKEGVAHMERLYWREPTPPRR